MSEIAVELRDLRKVFPTVVANDGVSLRVKRGTIHGIVGENGAGKSTTMKMLYGVYRPDGGEILVDGVKREWRSTLEAIRAGVGMVHQHFMLAGPMTALDNILLGAETSRFGFLPRSIRPLDRASARARLTRLAEQYGLPVDWDAWVENLPVGVQQRIEILKLLYRDARVLILDEPTAVLTPQETQGLFENLKKLKGEGKSILVITHKLSEVMRFTDHVTVFRAGRVMGEVETSETSPQHLAELMVGRKVQLSVQAPPAPILGETCLKLGHLSLGADKGHARSLLDRISLEVRGGEVVGIAGVEGNGQSELIQAILHPGDRDCRSSGRVEVLGHDVSTWETARIRKLGVGVIPEDRHREGLLLDRPLHENFFLGLRHQKGFVRRGWIAKSIVRARAQAAMEEYDVRPRAVDAAARGLSGGNQQKLIIAREFERQPRLLIAAQPTRGVDVGAIEFIHHRILKARAEGAGVLLISSELDEILSLSDRILVMYEGRVAASFKRGECTERELGLSMGGAAAGSRGDDA